MAKMTLRGTLSNKKVVNSIFGGTPDAVGNHWVSSRKSLTSIKYPKFKTILCLPDINQLKCHP
jgi:hypothetical protein